ncbi:prepilin-type N-terminal cleavage/methylation domain-containing protein [Thermodesulfovibrio sp. 3907-1M]|uniref:Prepilin-type N-terminal cleavage/methylation domain-containing protein n=1 Tax=Thermodesulfovibrio autotrophicus TaxID=3118333 RepID=A0AAU8GW54_9BACT
MDRKVAGFSLFELLIIIAIVSFLMYIGYSQYTKYKADRELMRQANQLADDIGWIKSQSISKEPHGMVINLDNYTLFKDIDGNCSFTAQDKIISVVNFMNGITNSSITIFVFDRKGYPRDSNCGIGASGVTLKNTNNNQKIININKYGRIQIQ